MTAYDDAVIADGATTFYPTDETSGTTAVDAAGSADASLTGSDITYAVDLFAQKGFEFGSIGDTFFGAPVDVSGGPITLECLLRIYGDTANFGWFGLSDSSEAGIPAGQGHYKLGESFGAIFGGINGAGPGGGGSVTAGNDYHCMYVVNSDGSTRLYLNGALSASSTAGPPTPISTSGDSVWFPMGWFGGAPSHVALGKIAIYDGIALSGAAAAAHYALVSVAGGGGGGGGTGPSGTGTGDAYVIEPPGDGSDIVLDLPAWQTEDNFTRSGAVGNWLADTDTDSECILNDESFALGSAYYAADSVDSPTQNCYIPDPPPQYELSHATYVAIAYREGTQTDPGGYGAYVDPPSDFPFLVLDTSGTGSWYAIDGLPDGAYGGMIEWDHLEGESLSLLTVDDLPSNRAWLGRGSPDDSVPIHLAYLALRVTYTFTGPTGGLDDTRRRFFG